MDPSVALVGLASGIGMVVLGLGFVWVLADGVRTAEARTAQFWKNVAIAAGFVVFGAIVAVVAAYDLFGPGD